MPAQTKVKKKQLAIGTFKSMSGAKQPFYVRIRNTRNRNIVADGAEGFATRANAKRAAKRLVKLIQAGDFEFVDE